MPQQDSPKSFSARPAFGLEFSHAEYISCRHGAADRRGGQLVELRVRTLAARGGVGGGNLARFDDLLEAAELIVGGGQRLRPAEHADRAARGPQVTLGQLDVNLGAAVAR